MTCTSKGGQSARRHRHAGRTRVPIAGMDVAIGRLLREARRQAGLGRRKLALALGISVPSLQKYESGNARMTPERLAAAARVLDLPMSYFFQDIPRATARSGVAGPYTADELQVIRCYRAIGDLELRKEICRLLADLGAGAGLGLLLLPAPIRREG